MDSHRGGMGLERFRRYFVPPSSLPKRSFGPLPLTSRGWLASPDPYHLCGFFAISYSPHTLGNKTGSICSRDFIFTTFGNKIAPICSRESNLSSYQTLFCHFVISTKRSAWRNHLHFASDYLVNRCIS